MQSEPDLPLLSWRPPPVVVPFPAVRNRTRLRTMVEQAARFSEATAERMILNAADKRRAHLERIGVSPDIAKNDAERLQAEAFVMLRTIIIARGA